MFLCNTGSLSSYVLSWDVCLCYFIYITKENKKCHLNISCRWIESTLFATVRFRKVFVSLKHFTLWFLPLLGHPVNFYRGFTCRKVRMRAKKGKIKLNGVSGENDKLTAYPVDYIYGITCNHTNIYMMPSWEPMQTHSNSCFCHVEVVFCFFL